MADEVRVRDGGDVLAEGAVRGQVERARRGEGDDVGKAGERRARSRGRGLRERTDFECADGAVAAGAEPALEDVVEGDGAARLDGERGLLAGRDAGAAARRER